MAEENKNAKIDANQQEKLKNQTQSADQDEQIKQTDPAELRKKLSNKNQDYVFRLQKELEKQGNLSSDEASQKVNKLLPEILVAQRHGQPANSLFMASPIVKADKILHPVVKPKTLDDLPFWQRGVDNALFWLAIFMGMYGLLGLFNTKQLNSQNGVLTITVVGILFGLMTSKYNEWIMPQGAKGKIKWGRAILSLGGLVVALFVIITLLTLPGIRVINPVLPGIVYIIIAAIAYGIRYFFRKKYNITGSAFGPSAR